MKKKSLSLDSQKQSPSVVLRKSPFKNRDSLVPLLTTEPHFKIQVFSLESIEIFEDFLHVNRISFVRGFTSSPPVSCSDIALLLSDGPLLVNIPRVILYSNIRDFQFIPYQFKLTYLERESILSTRKVTQEQRALAEAVHSGSLTRTLAPPLRLSEATAGALSYLQCVIIMCLAKEKRLKYIWKEVRDVDPEIGGLTVIRAELNWLCKHKFCTRSGDIFRLRVSPETVRLVSERIGFINS